MSEQLHSCEIRDSIYTDEACHLSLLQTVRERISGTVPLTPVRSSAVTVIVVLRVATVTVGGNMVRVIDAVRGGTVVTVIAVLVLVIVTLVTVGGTVIVRVIAVRTHDF